jgi:hypothetical protein
MQGACRALAGRQGPLGRLDHAPASGGPQHVVIGVGLELPAGRLQRGSNAVVGSRYIARYLLDPSLAQRHS